MINSVGDSSAPTLGGRVVRGVVSSFTLGIATNIFLFVGQILIPRLLTRPEYAEFTVSISFVSLLSIIADLGMNPYLTRAFAHAEEEWLHGHGDRRGTLLGSMLVLRIVLSLLVAGIAISIGRVLYSATQVSNIEILLLTLIVSSRLYIVRSVPEAVLRSIGRYYLAASFALIDAVLFAVLLATLRNSALTLHQIVWIYTLCNLPGFVLIVGFVGVWVKKSNFRLSVQWRTVVEMIRGSVPLTLGSVFLMVHYESDKLLLDKLSNPFEVSAYGATIRLLTAASPLALVISAVTAPELTRLLFRGDLERARRLTHMSLRVLLVVAGCIALIVTAYSSQLIIVLYGQKYANEGSLFALSSWMLIPLFFAGYINEMSIAAGEFRSWTFYNLFIMLVLIAGDVLLIPSLGASGAMISRLASIVLGSALILYLKRGADYLDLRIARSTFLKLIACIAIAFAILKLMAYFESAMTLGIAAALVAYFLSVHLSRMLSYHDAMSVLRRVRLP